MKKTTPDPLAAAGPNAVAPLASVVAAHDACDSYVTDCRLLARLQILLLSLPAVVKADQHLAP